MGDVVTRWGSKVEMMQRIMEQQDAICMILSQYRNVGSKNGTSRCYLAGFSENIAFSCHFVAIHPPSTLPPYRSTTGIGYTSKKLFKMVGNSASYSPNSW